MSSPEKEGANARVSPKRRFKNVPGKKRTHIKKESIKLPPWSVRIPKLGGGGVSARKKEVKRFVLERKS